MNEKGLAFSRTLYYIDIVLIGQMKAKWST